MNDKTNKYDKMLTFVESGKRIYSNSLYPTFCEVPTILILFQNKMF